MSSSGYRDRGFRGGRGGFRGGRGGFNHRRYWDNDDYDRKRRRGRSRSRSRSDSRSSRSYSRSHSRSKSHSRSPDSSKKAEVYQTKPDNTTTISNSTVGVAQNNLPNIDAALELYGQLPPPTSALNGQQFGLQEIKYPLGYGGGSATTMNSFGLGFSEPFQNTKAPVTAPPPPIISNESSKKKKKKDGKKKKKRRRRSSSSSSPSSSSSDDSSERRKKRKAKKKKAKETDESSDSFSEPESKPVAPASAGVGMGVPTPQQRDQLEKQKEGYKSKLVLLETELKRLKAKEHELKKDRAGRDKIDENLKLQAEIVGRCKAVNIVVGKIDDVLAGGKRPVSSANSAPQVTQALTQHTGKIPTNDAVKLEGKTLNLDFYDAGQYWCRLCNIFPETLSEMLDHFHGKEHHLQIEQLGIEEKPWRKGGHLKETKAEPGAKRIPFRGIQFFSPVQGWYCRLCSEWMGDHHCAMEHLKGVEHNSNFLNFVEEHPEWEGKWLVDREHARKRAGLEDRPRKSRFDSVEANARSSDKKGKDDNSRSIHVEMRNSMPVKEESTANFVALTADKNDKSVDEWMGKPASAKVNLDIDTQKFAAIVREKHGAQKEKEKATKKSPAAAEAESSQQAQGHSRESRDNDRSDRRDNRKSDSRVELSFAGRRDDRDRNRDARGGGRRRTRSRSRSRDRDRRRSPARRDRRDNRSKSRDRDRRRDSRDSRDRDQKREKDSKELTKKLPLIGKMPLFKKPAVSAGKEKEAETNSSNMVTPPNSGSSKNLLPEQSEYGSIGPSNPISTSYDPIEAYNDATAMEQHIQAKQGAVQTEYQSYPMQGTSQPPAGYDTSAMTISSTTGASAYMYENSVYTSVSQSEPTPYDDLKPPGEKETPLTGTGGTALPDDLQQALDLIYAGSSVKPSLGSGIPFPPPGVPPVEPAAATAKETGDQYASEYGGSFNFGDYDPDQQQNSFEGYAPMFDEEEAPPGVDMPSAQYKQPTTVSNISNQPEADTDDIDDLRMLGIDMDDTAAALFRK